MGAEAKETCDVDYVWNARELYRVFLRTGGAPHKKYPKAFDEFAGGNTAEGGKNVLPYAELLGDKEWTLSKDIEEVAIMVSGRPVKCAVARNLGQVRSLLEGGCRDYEVVRLMA